MNMSLIMRTGRCHVYRYLRPLLDSIQAGDASFVVTRHLELEQAPQGYETFKHKQDGASTAARTAGRPLLWVVMIVVAVIVMFGPLLLGPLGLIIVLAALPAVVS